MTQENDPRETNEPVETVTPENPSTSAHTVVDNVHEQQEENSTTESVQAPPPRNRDQEEEDRKQAELQAEREERARMLKPSTEG